MGWFSLNFEKTAKPPRLRHPSFEKGGEFEKYSQNYLTFFLTEFHSKFKIPH